MLENINPQMIQDIEGVRQVVVLLLNIVEELKQENLAQGIEIQRLRDEINRLKGEQGKPDIKPSKKPNNDYSSEDERRGKRKPRKPKKRKKLKDVKIDREEYLEVDKAKLLKDAKFQGYDPVIIQDLRIETDNIRFHRARYYSASEGKNYVAPLPKGYKGQFGPTIRSLVVSLYYAAGMSEPKIIEFLEQMGVNISKGKVSSLLTKETEPWQAEADDIMIAGLGSSRWQHIDDTGTRVNGVNGYCHILCNPFYTAYATRPKKNRLTVITLLQNSEEPVFLFNQQTEEWLDKFRLPFWVRKEVVGWSSEKLRSETEVADLLTEDMSKRLNQQQQARIYEAGALAAYYAQDKYPVIPILVSDDAPQFRHLTKKQALCWVHEGRHYKKLQPQVAYHREILDKVLTQFWDYYHDLQAYRAAPDPKKMVALRQAFKTIFSQTTDYDQLNQRLAKTLAHEEKLLVVLDHPTVILHNNPAELGARQRVRKRDVSFGPRTKEGRIAWDSFMTVAETAKKLGVSFYQYVLDRVSQKNTMPSLADIIRSRGQPA
ncbi:MAG: transposase [Cocleimonas sp.]|nr:transposase [Cocleimonas sp.]